MPTSPLTSNNPCFKAYPALTSAVQSMLLFPHLQLLPQLLLLPFNTSTAAGLAHGMLAHHPMQTMTIRVLFLSLQGTLTGE
jgi:hypothetical protein